LLDSPNTPAELVERPSTPAPEVDCPYTPVPEVELPYTPSCVSDCPYTPALSVLMPRMAGMVVEVLEPWSAAPDPSFTALITGNPSSGAVTVVMFDEVFSVPSTIESPSLAAAGAATPIAAAAVAAAAVAPPTRRRRRSIPRRGAGSDGEAIDGLASTTGAADPVVVTAARARSSASMWRAWRSTTACRSWTVRSRAASRCSDPIGRCSSMRCPPSSR
jgi:hypothetical protein